MSIGKKIKIHYSFILLLIISLFSGYFKIFISFFALLLIHELGHFFFIIMTKTKIVSIRFTIVGLFLKVNNCLNNPFKNILIYSGGLLFSILIQLIFFKNNTTLLMKYNLLIIILNLIPIVPLDGYNILYTILSLVWEDEFLNDLFLYIGMLIIVIMMIFFVINKYFLILYFCLFFCYKLIDNYYKTKKYLKIKHRSLFYKANYE